MVVVQATSEPVNEFDPEEPVIDAIRGGDRYAFEEFIGRHSRWIRSVVYGVLGDLDATDDVTQQVWLAFWQRIGSLQDVRRWRPWTYRLARNAALDAGRERSRRRQQTRVAAQIERAASAITNGRDEPTSPDSSRDDTHEHVLTAIHGLPAIYREPFVLRHLADWSYREIGDVMGLPVDTVETRLVRARRLLRETLAHTGPDD